MHCEAVHAAWCAGLDPFLGVYHDLSYGRESLACDLVEPIRPALDRWIWQLFHERVLRLEHFAETDEGCWRLGPAGLQFYYQNFGHSVKPWRRLLRRYARRFSGHLDGLVQPDE